MVVPLGRRLVGLEGCPQESSGEVRLPFQALSPARGLTARGSGTPSWVLRLERPPGLWEQVSGQASPSCAPAVTAPHLICPQLLLGQCSPADAQTVSGFVLPPHVSGERSPCPRQSACEQRLSSHGDTWSPLCSPLPLPHFRPVPLLFLPGVPAQPPPHPLPPRVDGELPEGRLVSAPVPLVFLDLRPLSDTSLVFNPYLLFRHDWLSCHFFKNCMAAPTAHGSSRD